MDIKKLESFVDEYIEKTKESPEIYKKDLEDRLERKRYYQGYDAKKIKVMTLDDMYEYIGKLWSMIMWGNKKYVVDKIIENNGFENLKSHLIELLYGKKKIEDRWDHFLKSIKGMGPATISELLTYIYPYEYIILNKTTITCFAYLGIPNVPTYDYQLTGKKCLELNKIAKSIANVMKQKGVENPSLLAVDYFLWNEIMPYANNKKIITKEAKDIQPSDYSDKKISFHNEIQRKIVEIGSLLGFESSLEVRVAPGAIVDAVWESRIGNMGKVIYVFEVQSKGSTDSLIVNLIKSKGNSAVQAVVAVSDLKQLETIKKHCESTPLEKELRIWDINEVLLVHDSLTKAHEFINKLGLVPDSFV